MNAAALPSFLPVSDFRHTITPDSLWILPRVSGLASLLTTMEEALEDWAHCGSSPDGGAHVTSLERKVSSLQAQVNILGV